MQADRAAGERIHWHNAPWASLRGDKKPPEGFFKWCQVVTVQESEQDTEAVVWGQW